MKITLPEKHSNNLCLILLVVIISIFCNGAMAYGKDVYKPSRVIQKEYNMFEGWEITYLDLTYDNAGHLTRFVEYFESREDRPRFDVSLEWFDDYIVVTGFVDWNHDLEGTIVYLNDQGLASKIIVTDDGYIISYDVVFENNRLMNISANENYFDFVYDNDELLGMLNGSYNESIDFSYDNTDHVCNIPFPGIWYNCMYYYRFLAYAGLLGQPMNHLPSEYNRYDNGWSSLNYTFDENVNVTSILSDGGLTHSSWDSQEFIYEYTLTSSIDDNKLIDNISINTEGTSVVIKGKDREQQVMIYNLAGQLLKSSKDDRIEIGQKGIYLIKIDNSYHKVFL